MSAFSRDADTHPATRTPHPGPSRPRETRPIHPEACELTEAPREGKAADSRSRRLQAPQPRDRLNFYRRLSCRCVVNPIRPAAEAAAPVRAHTDAPALRLQRETNVSDWDKCMRNNRSPCAGPRCDAAAESPQPRLRTGPQGHRDMTLAVRCQLRLYPRSRCDSRRPRLGGPPLRVR